LEPPTANTYAAGFSEQAFALISIGTTREGVLRLLGPPLQKSETSNGTIVWYYSEGLSKNFEHRAVVFDKAGKVNKKAVRIMD